MLHFKGSDYRRSRGSTWYDRMDSLLMDLGLTKSKSYSNLYFKVECRRPMMFLLYVDGLFLTKKRNSLKLQEGDLGMMNYFLSIEVWHNTYVISLGQGKYAVEILKRFR